ncbi:MAG: hypothetical protein ABIP03_09865 [Aquihabitans sp.]
MNTELLMYLGFGLGAVGAILFFTGHTTAGVVFAILTGLLRVLHAVSHNKA